MKSIVQRIALWLRPDLSEYSGVALIGQTLNLYAAMFTAPLLIVGLVWLVAQTNIIVLSANWEVLLLLFGLALLFTRFPFEVYLQLRPGVTASTGGTLGFVATFSGVLIFGPSAYWVAILTIFINALYGFFADNERSSRWAAVSTGFVSGSNGVLATLVFTWLYPKMGGTFPFSSFSLASIIPAVLALAVYILVPYFIMAPIIWTISQAFIDDPDGAAAPSQIVLFILTSSLLPQLAVPFTLLAAVLYAQMGVGIYLFFLSGVLLASILASALTNSVRQRTQRARELEALERLGRDILAAPPEITSLPDILNSAFQRMSSSGQGCIWLCPNKDLFRSESPLPELERVREKVEAGSESHYIFQRVQTSGRIRWDGLAVPILDDDGEVQGGVYLRIPRRSEKMEAYLPALQSLAAEVASAVYRIQAHEQALIQERMSSELAFAGTVQANFLPDIIPDLDGYEITASITPARQTSGDFYDFIPLTGGRLGVLIADVADKGTGAALFMALSRTLIRTYALEFPDDPDRVMLMANQRILADARSPLFVTIFYAVIDPANHQMIFINGGHNPPYLAAKNGQEQPPKPLARTGIPLGIFEDAKWTTNQVVFHPEDLLILFTDGVTEAMNAEGEMFKDENLLHVLTQSRPFTASHVHDDVRSAVQEFSAGVPQGDDVTLVVIQRLPNPDEKEV